MSNSLVGLNLAQAYDWSPPMLADAVKQARPFGSLASPSDGKPGTLDAAGWPTGAHGLICAADVKVGKGTYRFTATQGTLKSATLNDIAATNVRVNGSTTTADFVLPADTTSLTLKVDGTGLHYSLRRPGCSDSDIWMPEVINDLKTFGVLRTMDVCGTNGTFDNLQVGNRIKTWADRPTDKTVNWQAGVSLEAICDLANKAGCDLWYCVPFGADDDYVAKAAALFKANTTRHVYLEYSNEVWNGGTSGNDVPWYGFAQAVYVDRLAKKEAATSPIATPWTDDWTRKTNETAALSLHLAKIVKPLMGDQVRVILPLQFVQGKTTCMVWGQYFAKIGVKPSDWFYAAAGSPYTDLREDLRTKANATVDELFAGLDRWATQATFAADFVAGAKSLGLLPVAYEGCLNLWDQPGTHVPAKVALQSDPRIAAYLAEFYAGWFAAGGNVFCHYQFATAWRDDSACFGILQDARDTSGPKYQAMATAAAKYVTAATPVPAPTPIPVPVPTPVPIPTPTPATKKYPSWYEAFGDDGQPFVILTMPDGTQRVLKPVN